MKTLYIIRHGETEYNKKGMVQGSGIDAPLNENGRKQAQAFFEAYKDVKFDKVYTSNLKRTVETVQGFLDLGLPTEALADLREISWGRQEGVAFTPETSTEYQYICEQWAEGNLEAKIEGGENPIEVEARLAKGFEYITNQPKEDTVLVCVHGRVIRILMCWMLGIPLSEMDMFRHTNTGLYLVTFEHGEYTIEQMNEVAHLEGVEFTMSSGR